MEQQASSVSITQKPQLQLNAQACRLNTAILGLQVLEQAARVAIEADVILNQAAKMQQASQRHIAALWTDGSLGNVDGLPDRKTRIYIPESMLCKTSQVITENQQSPAVIDGQHSLGEQPAKKKRKGKAERNRLKREAAEKAILPDAA